MSIADLVALINYSEKMSVMWDGIQRDEIKNNVSKDEIESIDEVCVYWGLVYDNATEVLKERICNWK